MKENKIVYGLIGFGGMGKWHTEILENVPEIELAGIYDIKEEKRKLAEEAGFHTYETEEAMLADESIDVILVATPNDTHRPIALRAMEAGKNVIVEKPATLSLKELTELEDMAGKTGQFLTVHQNRRWDEDLLTVREILKDQTMGEIFRIESRVHGSRGIPGDWRKEKAHGGGMVLDWGVHLFDQIFRLTGERRLKTVYATLTNVTNQEVDDGFTAVLRFEGGLEVLVEVGTNNFISLPRWYVLGPVRKDCKGFLRRGERNSSGADSSRTYEDDGSKKRGYDPCRRASESARRYRRFPSKCRCCTFKRRRTGSEASGGKKSNAPDGDSVRVCRKESCYGL